MSCVLVKEVEAASDDYVAKGGYENESLLRVYPRSTSNLEKGFPIHVLVCSDYAFISNELKTGLQHAVSPRKVEFTICPEFSLGAELIKTNDFDIILVDVDTSGAHEFISQVNETQGWTGVVVVAITAFFDKYNLYEIFSSGARYCISKQKPNMDILRRIANVLHR